MMKNAKRILITTRTSEIYILQRSQQKAIRAFCEICKTETEMLDLNSAVTVCQIGTRELIQKIESGVIHSVETPSGHLLVCQASLQNFFK